MTNKLFIEWFRLFTEWFREPYLISGFVIVVGLLIAASLFWFTVRLLAKKRAKSAAPSEVEKKADGLIKFAPTTPLTVVPGTTRIPGVIPAPNWFAGMTPEAALQSIRADRSRAAEAAQARAARALRTRIFISYRRASDAAQAGRIADRLGNEFGPDRVFMDVDAISLGANFVEVINKEIAKSHTLLVIIGSALDARSADGQQLLDNPADFVRLEIAAALKHDVNVIPILVDGAKIPPADRLPEEIRGLAERHAFDLRNAAFKADMDRLVRELKKEVEKLKKEVQELKKELKKTPESRSSIGNFMGEFLGGFIRRIGG